MELKNKLEEEKKLLEKELGAVAKRDPENPGDWVPAVGMKDQSTADENTVADTFEELENNTGVVTRLENRLTDVTDALTKIQNGTYGICEKGDHPIEADRLEANPAARTCKEHM